MINVLADKYLYKISHFLPNGINLTFYDPQQPLKEIPGGTQALLVRTTTEINPNTYPNLPASLEFVATASSGTNHVDIPWLKKTGITFADAAGCNARAVAEYIATALLIWAVTKNIDYTNLTVGIIGVGNTGSEVKKLLQSLEIATVGNDPPKQKREEGFASASLNEALRCDILTFHVPLTFEADYPTYHWLDEEKLDNNHFQLIINAARGGVVDETALLKALKNKRVDDYILDVWENEPVFKDEVAKNAFIKTPHIAGYSIQAKHNASAIIADAFCEYFGMEAPAVQTPEKKEAIEIPPSVSSLAEILYFLHPIDEYNKMLSKLIGGTASIKRKGFNHIRTTHPLRNEYRKLCLFAELFDRFAGLRKLFKR